MENQWLAWAKKLQALASTGAFFTTDEFDRERYDEIAAIANNMLAQLGRVPIERIRDLAQPYASGYVTPQIDVRGALIRDGRILLVREALDGLWTLPGGYADVGLSAAANTEKEVIEEANLRVAASRLYGLFHKARHEYLADTRDFYKFYFLCTQLEPGEPAPGPETLDADFFKPDDLPPLSTGRVIAKHIHLAFDCHAADDDRLYFD